MYVGINHIEQYIFCIIIHFLNIVGDDDMLVKPSASIIEWDSTIPSGYKSFKQMILNTDHFMFARPGFEKEKKEIARWFAGYSFPSMVFKLKTAKDAQFVNRAAVIRESLIRSYRKSCDADKKSLLENLNEIVGQKPVSGDITELSAKTANIMTTSQSADVYDDISRMIAPFVEKSYHRQGHAD